MSPSSLKHRTRSGESGNGGGPSTSAASPGGAAPAAHGLSSSYALSKTISDLEAEAARHRQEVEEDLRREAFRRGLSASEVTALFHWSSAVAGGFASLFLLMAAAAAAASSSNGGGGGEAWSLAALGLLVGAASVANVALSVREQRLRLLEKPRRVDHVIRRLLQVRDHVHWQAANYPHLHTPLSASIVLQWAVRDRRHVNVPWALLVEGDVILLKPGQAAPGRCRSVDKPDLVMESGEVLHVRSSSSSSSAPAASTKAAESTEDASPTPEFKTPAAPQLFVLEETPYLEVVRKVLRSEVAGDSSSRRPTSILHKYAHLFFVRYLVHWLLPAVFAAAFAWNVVILDREWSLYVKEDLHELLLDPVAVALPLLPLSFPAAWLVSNYASLAWVLGVYSSSRHVKMTDDPFEDTVEEPEIR